MMRAAYATFSIALFLILAAAFASGAATLTPSWPGFGPDQVDLPVTLDAPAAR